ncbi:MAG: cytochrome c oxidase subunit 3 [Arcobacteraceae bacterium]|jgi:nitric oxide reductase NorE protein|nr:cytochrome c oxidase subunit 3 [Arcobacteraceae bacterium]
MSKNSYVEEQYPPGDFAIWVIIYIELLTFGLLFLGYAYSRKQDLEVFIDSQVLVNQTIGFVNTILLITSSYFVAKAVHTIKLSKNSLLKTSLLSSKWLLGAMLLGGGFLVFKIYEFNHLFAQGITLSTNKFFMFYLFLTVFHFLHVILGMVILFTLYQKTRLQGYTPDNCSGLETGASYWHMVDLLWIVLFPLVYII